MPEFPLWQLKPEDVARLIVYSPARPVEKHLHWRKREVRTHPSLRYAPRHDDLDRLALAKPNHQGKLNSYWTEAFRSHAELFPVIGVAIGPLLANGLFFSYRDKISNPLPTEREREPWQGMYSRAQYEEDITYFERGRALLRENFYLGQTGQGPYLDGLVFMSADNRVLAEMEHCKARLRATWAIIEARKHEKANASAKAQGKQEPDWKSIGHDEAVAMCFKHKGYPIRKVGLHNYEVLLNPAKPKKRSTA